MIRAAIRNLSGIPSIIYGLFGLALFVQAMRLGTSLILAGLKLGLEGTYEHPDIASQSDEQGVFYLPEIKIPGTYYLLIQREDQSKTIEVHLNKDSEIHVRL